MAEAEAAVVLQTRRRRAYEARRESVAEALRGLGEVLGKTADGGHRRAAADRAPLQAAASLVADACGAPLRTAERPEPERVPAGVDEAAEMLTALARRSGVRTRQIALTPG